MIGLALVGGHPALSLSFLALAVAMRVFAHVCVDEVFFFSSQSALHAHYVACTHTPHLLTGTDPGAHLLATAAKMSSSLSQGLANVFSYASLVHAVSGSVGGATAVSAYARSIVLAHEHANFGGATACPHLDLATERRRGKRHTDGDADVHLATEFISRRALMPTCNGCRCVLLCACMCVCGREHLSMTLVHLLALTPRIDPTRSISPRLSRVILETCLKHLPYTSSAHPLRVLATFHMLRSCSLAANAIGAESLTRTSRHSFRHRTSLPSNLRSRCSSRSIRSELPCR